MWIVLFGLAAAQSHPSSAASVGVGAPTSGSWAAVAGTCDHGTTAESDQAVYDTSLIAGYETVIASSIWRFHAEIGIETSNWRAWVNSAGACTGLRVRFYDAGGPVRLRNSAGALVYGQQLWPLACSGGSASWVDRNDVYYFTIPRGVDFATFQVVADGTAEGRCGGSSSSDEYGASAAVDVVRYYWW